MLGSCSAKGCLSRSFTSLSPSPKCLARFHIWNARSRLATQTDDQLKHGKVPPEWCSVLYYYQMNLLDFCSFYCRAFLLFVFLYRQPSCFRSPFYSVRFFSFPLPWFLEFFTSLFLSFLYLCMLSACQHCISNHLSLHIHKKQNNTNSTSTYTNTR